jgi:hypothetical protein
MHYSKVTAKTEKNKSSLHLQNITVKSWIYWSQKLHFPDLYSLIIKKNLEQAWATSGPRATCGPQSLLMLWPESYISSILESYFDVGNMLEFKKAHIFLKNNLKIRLLCSFGTNLSLKINWIPNLSLMWPTETKELSTSALEGVVALEQELLYLLGSDNSRYLQMIISTFEYFRNTIAFYYITVYSFRTLFNFLPVHLLYFFIL